DASDAQWRNFRGNLPILTIVLGYFTLVANMLRAYFRLQAMGMSVVWLLISLTYLSYLHGAFILFVVAIASVNFLLAKVRVVQVSDIFGRTKYFSLILWTFNLSFLLCNRIYEGYSFSSLGFNNGFPAMGLRVQYMHSTTIVIMARARNPGLIWTTSGVPSDGISASILKCKIEIGALCSHFGIPAIVLRMISFGYDYHWADRSSRIDQKKHIQHCHICSSGKTCYLLLQERSVQNDKFSFVIYLCYIVYAPLYIAGPVISFNAFASQLDTPQKNYSLREVAWYGLRWGFSLLQMELMTHFFYYNAFAISGLWKQLTPLDVFIIGYGVLNFMWLKFFLTWRYFRFWSLISGIEAPENMPRYMYIPLGGSQRKLLNVWVVFTFVAIWHDLEWKLLSWAWLTCIFFIPELIVKSAANAFQVESTFGEFVFRELSAVAGAVTITCLMCKVVPYRSNFRESDIAAAERFGSRILLLLFAVLPLLLSCFAVIVNWKLQPAFCNAKLSVLQVANLVGFVIGPSGINWLMAGFLQKEGLPTLGGIFITFYVGTKDLLMVCSLCSTSLIPSSGVIKIRGYEGPVLMPYLVNSKCMSSSDSYADDGNGTFVMLTNLRYHQLKTDSDRDRIVVKTPPVETRHCDLIMKTRGSYALPLESGDTGQLQPCITQ
ncbi:hypothetical protein RJ639_045372, partial [Escallonia herrerae]